MKKFSFEFHCVLNIWALPLIIGWEHHKDETPWLGVHVCVLCFSLYVEIV